MYWNWQSPPSLMTVVVETVLQWEDELIWASMLALSALQLLKVASVATLLSSATSAP